MRWIITTYKRAFDYSGRSRRMEYWAFALFAFVLLNVVGGVSNAVGIGDIGRNGHRDGGILGLLTLLGVVVPGLAVAVRRLHDINFAGWWLALPAAPVIGWAILILAHLNPEWLFRIFLIAIVVSPLVLLVLMFLPGTRGPNRFGDDPKAPGLEDTFA